MDSTDMIIAQGRIVGAVRQTSGLAGRYATIREVRALAALPAAHFDAAAIGLFRAQAVNLVPRSAQMLLTDADRAAAVRCGGEAKTLIAWCGQ